MIHPLVTMNILCVESHADDGYRSAVVQFHFLNWWGCWHLESAYLRPVVVLKRVRWKHPARISRELQLIKYSSRFHWQNRWSTFVWNRSPIVSKFLVNTVNYITWPQTVSRQSKEKAWPSESSISQTEQLHANLTYEIKMKQNCRELLHVSQQTVLTERSARWWGICAKTWTGLRSPSVPSVWADELCLGPVSQREFPSLCVETGTSPAEDKTHTHTEDTLLDRWQTSPGSAPTLFTQTLTVNTCKAAVFTLAWHTLNTHHVTAMNPKNFSQCNSKLDFSLRFSTKVGERKVGVHRHSLINRFVI